MRAVSVQGPLGEVPVHLQTGGFWQNSASVDITPIGLQMPELPWMALFA